MSRRKKKNKSNNSNNNVRSVSFDVADVILLIFMLAFIAGASCALWWAEDQDARYRQLIDVANQQIVELSDLSKVDPAYDGKVVYAFSKPSVAQELTDPLLGISKQALLYRRDVEYYQVVERERKHKENGQAPKIYYEYESKWTDHPIDPSSYNTKRGYGVDDARSPHCVIKNTELVADNVGFGAYRLPELLITAMHHSEPFEPAISLQKQETLARIWDIDINELHLTPYGLYIGNDPDRPRVGDVKVKLTMIPVTDMSIIAKVKGDTFDKYRLDEERQNVNLALAVPGKVSKEEMFDELLDNVSTGAIIIGIIGGVVVMITFFFLPWDWLIERLSFVRLLLNGDKDDNSEWGLLSIIRMSVSYLLIFSAIVWMPFRPMMAIVLIAVAAIILFSAFIQEKAKKAFKSR